MLLIDLQIPEACDVCPLNYDFCWCRGFKEGEFDKYSDDWNDQVCEGEHRPEYCPLKEIVRCKDCKYRSEETYTHGVTCKEVYVCQINDVAKNPDWYCADGELTDDG